ncbi:MAG: GtrA family protein [Oscillospiraceae bacterium]
MFESIKQLIKKYSETILYLVFGVLTVIVNMVIFLVLSNMFMGDLMANTIAFFIAVQFAYFANTKYVFKTKFTKQNFLRFWGMRIGTIFIDNIGLIILINIGINKTNSKLLINIIIIVLNYIFSKFFIFKKER